MDLWKDVIAAANSDAVPSVDPTVPLAEGSPPQDCGCDGTAVFASLVRVEG